MKIIEVDLINTLHPDYVSIQRMKPKEIGALERS